MPTLVLSPRHTDDSQALWRVAIARGWDVHRLPAWRIGDDLLDANEPFLYVEALFGPTLADELGVRLLDPPEDWLCMLPERYGRREVRLSTLGEARRLSVPTFVKPPNDKSFPAAVYGSGELPAAFDPEMKVLISEPVAFASEFRCFVLDRRIRTFSLYARQGESMPTGSWSDEETAQLLSFASALFADGDVDFPLLACSIADRLKEGVAGPLSS
jgi:hypothetical protein